MRAAARPPQLPTPVRHEEIAMRMVDSYIEYISFRTGPDGQTLYYPWGYFGPVYEVGSDQDKKTIKQWMRVVVLSIPVLIVLSNALPMSWLLVAVGVHFCLYAAGTVLNIRRLDQSKRSTLKRTMALYVGRISTWLLVAGLASCFALIGLGVFLLHFGESEFAPVAVLGICVFALVGVGHVRMLYLKLFARHEAVC